MKINKSIFILISFLSISVSNPITVTGKVVDEQNHPIPGVNVYSGTTGTETLYDGTFHLTMEENAVITLSHIGYYDITIPGSHLPELIQLKSAIVNGNEILVRAEFGNQNLQDTPASITVFGNRELNQRSENHFQSLIDLIPNLNYASGTSRPRYFQIRGIGERSQYTGEGAPNFSVGFMVDGIDFSGIGMTGMLFDAQQVEVFNGPQSSIYGPNAMAGLINITSAEPTPFYTGQGLFTTGTDNVQTFGIASGGPSGIINNLYYRLAYLKHSQDGFRENVYRNLIDSNGRDESSTTLKFNWVIFPKLNLQLVLFTADLNNRYDAWAVDNNENLITYSDEQGMDSQKSVARSLKLQNTDLFGVDAYYQYTTSTTELEHSYDGDWANNDFWLENPYNFDPAVTWWEYSFYDKTNRNRKRKTHEVRISSRKTPRLSWVTGYYTSTTIEIDEADGYLFGGDATSLNSKFDLENVSLYGQIKFNAADNLNVILNLRSENETTVYNSNGLNYDWASYSYMEIPTVEKEVQHSFNGGKLGVVFDLNQEFKLFSSISKGYKSGGINQNPNLSENSRLYDPEFNTNLEAGIKYTSSDVIANFTVFTMNRNDQQVQISSQQEDGNPNSFYYYTSNAASGTNSGAEFDGQFKLNENLTFRSTLGILKTHIDQYEFREDTSTVIILGDREQAMAPKYNFSVGTHYTHSSGFFADLELTGKDTYYFSDSHNQKSKAYQLVNFNTGIEYGNWVVSLWGKNILDTRYATRGFYFGNEPIWNEELQDHEYPDKLYLSYGDPLHYGLTLKYQY